MQGLGSGYGGVAEIAVSTVTHIHGGAEITKDHAVPLTVLATKNRHQRMAGDIRRDRQPGHIKQGWHQIGCLR